MTGAGRATLRSSITRSIPIGERRPPADCGRPFGGVFVIAKAFASWQAAHLRGRLGAGRAGRPVRSGPDLMSKFRSTVKPAG